MSVNLNSAIKFALLLSFIVVFCGCNTLSSLGLPFGGTKNNLLEPAKRISQSPGQSLLLPKELAEQPLNVYIVEIGDTVLLESVKFDATIRLPGDQLVKPDGYISLGECGRMIAANKTIEQIHGEAQSLIDTHVREDLEREYEADRRQRERERQSSPVDLEESNPEEDSKLDRETDVEERVALERRISSGILQNEISTRLVSWESKRVYVLGEVNSPGSFTFTGNQTVLDVLIEAGGLTAKSNHHQIIVSRPSNCNDCRTVMQICYDQIVQLGDASTNYQLLPGDRVFVPSLTFADDLKQSLGLAKSNACPRCAACPQGCNLPQGCEPNLTSTNGTVQVQEIESVTSVPLEQDNAAPAPSYLISPASSK